MFKKILIANRGEIAVRIIRACKEWGISTVAVHSDVDRESMHVKLADESVCIGSHQPANSYLNIPALLSAIDLTNAEAVHPGYGFLSENANFAKILEENKIKFIGASAKHIEMMGDKIQAKKIAKENGLPVIEGSEGGVQDVAAAKELCKKIGFPVLIKASGGGGGKGMKIVQKEEDFETLEDHQLQIQNMMGSRYLATFEEQVTKWQHDLASVADVVGLMSEIQRTWAYLETLFIGSEEVKKELPVDAERFVGIDVDVKQVLQFLTWLSFCTKFTWFICAKAVKTDVPIVCPTLSDVSDIWTRCSRTSVG